MNKLDLLNIILQSNTQQTLRRDVFSVRFSDIYADFINCKFIHDISDWSFTQQLYHYFYDDPELNLGICPECGKRCKFINFVLGYRKFCSTACANDSEYRKTNLEKYGSESYLASERFKEQYKQICQEKYGTDNAYQSEEVKEKIKQKCLKKYGTEYASQSADIKEKIKQTKLEKYGGELFTNREKAKQTCLEKHGHEYYTQTDEYKEKSYNTKKKNNSFNTSKIEEQIKLYLDSLGVNYKYQYTSEVYPFNCDFYFPDKDIYVEVQGTWTHGPGPFTGSDEDLKLLEKWRSKNKKYYQNAIDTWTIRDVKKREIAKQNNLNFLEIFSCDFDTCINEISKNI